MSRRRTDSYFATWQEAQAVCQKAGISRCVDYKAKYRSIDPRLVSNPNNYYSDWPGWSTFLGRTKYKHFYDTWQEASAVCQRMGIENSAAYEHCYKDIDARLPSNPNCIYDDWPGWDVFLNRAGKSHYSTWRRASKACYRLRIKTVSDYVKHRELDPALPANPEEYYSQWPGWEIFLGKLTEKNILPLELASALCWESGIGTRAEYKFLYNHVSHQLPASPERYYGRDWPGWKKFLFGAMSAVYATWQEAAEICRQAGFQNQVDYFSNYRKTDIRLPCHPEVYYTDWPGWDVFLGRKKREAYQTWQEASAAVVSAGIKSCYQYAKQYKQLDSRLPSNPRQRYDDWPGWDTFFGRRPNDYYQTWQEAGKVCVAMGVRNQIDYFDRHKAIDKRLPSTPMAYYKDWPGWDLFLGHLRRDFYKTLQEASLAAIRGGITDEVDYSKRYKTLDSRLPGAPNTKYKKDWVSWLEFLGKPAKKVFYPTLAEAQIAVIKLGINNYTSYIAHYRNDPKLHSNPKKFYQDWPGWDIFLGKRPVSYYPTLAEAKLVAMELKTKSKTDYLLKCNQDIRLHRYPMRFYPDWPGWKVFLGKK